MPPPLPQPVLAPLTPAAIFLVATIDEDDEATVHDARGPHPPGAAAGPPRGPDRPDPRLHPDLGYPDHAIIVTAVLRGVVRSAGLEAVRALARQRRRIRRTDPDRWS